MALKKLPNDIQHLLSASTQINSYKTAIEELVYNSLDALSTSIAIRVHIEEDSIQVVDNGHGIIKRNFSLLGQKYMTSKYVDITHFKTVPNKYGYRGESLANIIKISQTVKIISRHESGEVTLIKSFCNGNEQEIKELTTRPSKGTTVEVKGFLYNLSIQKKATDSMNVIQDLKTFLEQLSLIHSHISLSLRDDSRNEIVFKMHKKRDMYQTLSLLFAIERSDFQELIVEKKQYKVTALIEKTDKEIDRHWIFLNGKFINNCKLHKVINDLMAKSLCKDRGNQRTKFKTFKDDDINLYKNKIPFYFIFLTCPYIDYDVSYTSKKSLLEFKDWEQIKKLLEKLIKFYTGDIDLKEIKKQDPKLVNIKQDETRLEVKKIMDKILGGTSKNGVKGVTQMQKGIKGKCIKRKSKEKPKITLNILDPKKRSHKKLKQPKKDNGHSKSENKSRVIEPKTDNSIETRLDHINLNNDMNNERKKKYVRKTTSSEDSKIIQEQTSSKLNGVLGEMHNYKITENIGKNKSHKITKQTKTERRKKNKLKNNNNFSRKKTILKSKYNINSLHQNPTDDLNIRRDGIARKAKYLLECRKRRFCEKKAKQSEEMSNNIIVPVHKKLSKVYTHDPKNIPPKIQERPNYKTTYDLVHTIMNTQPQNNSQFKARYSSKKVIEYSLEVNGTNFIPKNNIINSNNETVSMLTYDSHLNYNKNDNHRTTTKVAQKFTNKLRNTHFITEESRDNFKFPIKKITKVYNPYDRYFKTKNISHKSRKIFNIDKFIEDNYYEETSYTIEFSENNHHEIFRSAEVDFKSPLTIRNQGGSLFHTSNNFDSWYYKVNCNMESTYTVLSSELLRNNIPVVADVDRPSNFTKHGHCSTFIETKTDNKLTKDKDNCISNIIVNDVIAETNRSTSALVFCTKSQCSNTEVLYDSNVEPLNICETILSNHDSGKRLLDNKEKNIINNDANIFNDECIIDPNQEEVELNMNVGTQPNNRIESLNTNINIEKSGNLRISQTMEQNTNVPCEENERNSHHFDMPNSLTLRSLNNNNKCCNENIILSPILTSTLNRNNKENMFNNKERSQNIYQEIVHHNEDSENAKINGTNRGVLLNQIETDTLEKVLNYFNLKNRLNFIPKGMSPIFTNCNNKGICDYNLEKDYYKNNIYDNFVNEVQVNSEVFEPRIENMKSHTTRDLEKVNNKLNKDNASLIFDGQSLKEAKVFGQVDGKFIAAILNGKCNNLGETSQFLILFDQHAVHERIRLENNLSDYINNDKWKSKHLDEISLKISKDEIVFLHNYTDKFDQFGLKWTYVSNNEISINAIPEAILGKNPRSVDKVIRAVKNLISEEINMIKLQKGCVSLYPKSIMDLVFSEACRYAIKFGDKLSKAECVELLTALSKCKTPFQCAHGRPVMAVLMDYKCENHKYKINFEKLKEFNKRK